jgi:hypothetical protein
MLEAGSGVNQVSFSPNGLLIVIGMDNGLGVWRTLDFEESLDLLVIKTR